MIFKRTLTTLLMVMTLNVYSQQHEAIKGVNQPPSPFDYNYTNLSYYNTHGTHKAWYLELNIQLLKKLNILELLNKQQFTFSKNSQISFENLIPEGIETIIFYGTSLKRPGTVNLVLYGNFSDKTGLDFISNKLYTINNQSQLTQQESKYYNDQEIYIFQLQNSDEKKFATRVKDGSLFVSNNYKLVRAMIRDYKGLSNSNPNEENNNLVILKVKNDIAIDNAQRNIDKSEPILQSQLFQKAKEIIATIHFQDSYFILNSTVKTKSKDLASQIEKILNGIVAINTLNNSEPKGLKSLLMNNFVINTNKRDVYFRTFLSLQDLQPNK